MSVPARWTGVKPAVPRKKATLYPVLKKQPASGVFLNMVSSSLKELMANEQKISVRNAAPLHRMRAALRRLHTAFLLFAPCLSQPARAGFEREIRRLAGILGEARDWDVFVDATLPEFLREQPEAPWFGLLRHQAAARRAAAYTAVKAELSGPALEALEVTLSRWMKGKYAKPGLADDISQSTGRLVPRLLTRLERKVTRRGRRVNSHNPRKLHAIRKSTKKLRYACEAVEAAFPRKRARQFIKSAKKLEKSLGRLNDAATARRQVSMLRPTAGIGILPAVAAIDRWCRRREKGDRGRIKPAWRRFEEQRRFWR
jgi:CHAD domain-containing protein